LYLRLSFIGFEKFRAVSKVICGMDDTGYLMPYFLE
jgi:hypothetical protein